jgi:hypothetical protein
MFRSARGHHQRITAQHSTVLTFVKHVCCFQDATCKDPSYLYNCSENKYQHFNHLTVYTMSAVHKGYWFASMPCYVGLIDWWWYLADRNLYEFWVWYYNITIWATVYAFYWLVLWICMYAYLITTSQREIFTMKIIVKISQVLLLGKNRSLFWDLWNPYYTV